MFEGVGKVSGCQIRVMIRLKTLIDAAFSYYSQYSPLNRKYTTNIQSRVSPRDKAGTWIVCFIQIFGSDYHSVATLPADWGKARQDDNARAIYIYKMSLPKESLSAWMFLCLSSSNLNIKWRWPTVNCDWTVFCSENKCFRKLRMLAVIYNLENVQFKNPFSSLGTVISYLVLGKD